MLYVTCALNGRSYLPFVMFKHQINNTASVRRSLDFPFLSDFGWWRWPDPLDPQEVSEPVQEAERHRGGECHRHFSVSFTQKLQLYSHKSFEALHQEVTVCVLGCTSCPRLASCVFPPWTWTTQWPSRNLTTFTVARNPYWTGTDSSICWWVRALMHCSTTASPYWNCLSGWREPPTSCLGGNRWWCAVMARSVRY